MIVGGIVYPIKSWNTSVTHGPEHPPCKQKTDIQIECELKQHTCGLGEVEEHQIFYD